MAALQTIYRSPHDLVRGISFLEVHQAGMPPLGWSRLSDAMAIRMADILFGMGFKRLVWRATEGDSRIIDGLDDEGNTGCSIMLWSLKRGEGAMMPELKPCPFCGSSNVDKEDYGRLIRCLGCGVSVRADITSAEEAWNRRASDALHFRAFPITLEDAIKVIRGTSAEQFEKLFHRREE